MNRVYNFSAGPSCLPEEVLTECAGEMLDFCGTGQSVMEMSHRSSAFKPIIQDAENMVRTLMHIPENYHVLFLQGGASTQFASVPLNLGVEHKNAAYVNTGVWANKAIKEAKKFINVDVVASSEDKNFSYIPRVEHMSGAYDYAYICLNNTIKGTRWSYIPDVGTVPLVADISSCILSEPLDVSKFALLFAGAQKNLGPAGVTLVIVRNDVLERSPLKETPTMLSYKIHADENSLYNTPPCYAIYVVGKVLHWIEKNGGADGMKARNEAKAKLLYDYLDASNFYYSPVEKESRSLMNIPFLTKETDAEKANILNKKFVEEASRAGLVNLAGHRTVGGMRASLYNAMPVEGVQKLLQFMDEFAKANQ